MSTDPTQQIFWLASRAFGIVAIIMLAISVGLGLAMSGRIIRRPGLPAKLKRYHEATTLVTLGLIVAHAAVLLADGYLRPGIAGITLPFQMSYRPLWTGIGIIAAWLAAISASASTPASGSAQRPGARCTAGSSPPTSSPSLTSSAQARTGARPG